MEPLGRHVRAARALVIALVLLVISIGVSLGPDASSGVARAAEPASPSASPELATQTSEQKIAAALAAGRIDRAQSLVYRILAAFGSDQLPEEYRSPIVDTDAATFAFGELAAEPNLLSPEQQTAVAPYTARPNDPDSVYNTAAAHVASTDGATGLLTWVNAPAAGGKARVWVPAGEGTAGRLATYAAEVERVWPVMFSFVPTPIPDMVNDPVAAVNPDAAIDLFFVDAGTVDQRLAQCRRDPQKPECTKIHASGGYTRSTAPFGGNTASGYIVIDSAVTGATLTSHIAHELTHTSQYRYDYRESSWLLDSTATWAAYHVLQKLGVTPSPEYDYEPDFFRTLDDPLTRDEGLNRYASWLYFLSLQVDYGDGIGRAIFEEMAASGVQGRKAVDEAFSFEDNLGPFAVSNWNSATADRYRSADGTFPTGLHADTDADVALPTDDDWQMPAETGYLSADYAHATFDQGIGLVILDNPLVDYNAECDCRPAVWLIENIAGTWRAPEALTSDTRRWCRERPEEQLDELVVVVANPDVEGLSPLPPDDMPILHTSNGSCGGEGTITITRDKHGMVTSARDNPVQVDVHDEATITFDLVLDDGSVDFYESTSSTMSWSRTLTSTEHANGCDILERDEGGGTYTGSGGQTLQLGVESTDGTFGGIVVNDDAYLLSVAPPGLSMDEGDPRGYYHVTGTTCAGSVIDDWWPYTTLAIVSGKLPEPGAALAGNVQRTLPPNDGEDLPTTETISWSLHP